MSYNIYYVKFNNSDQGEASVLSLALPLFFIGCSIFFIERISWRIEDYGEERGLSRGSFAPSSQKYKIIGIPGLGTG